MDSSEQHADQDYHEVDHNPHNHGGQDSHRINPEKQHHENGGHHEKDGSYPHEESKDEVAANGHKSRSDDRHTHHRQDNRWRSPRSHSKDRHQHRSRSGSSRSRSGQHDAPAVIDDTQVYVGGINRAVSGDDLRKHFERFGPIHEITMKTRYAFIKYDVAEDAKAAIKEMNQSQINGLTVSVETPIPGGSKKRKPTGPQKEDTCWYCNKPGHWQNECRSRKRARRRSRTPPRRRRSDSRDRRGGRGRDRSPRSRSRDDGRSKELREGRCFDCGDRGHIRRNCPQMGSRGRRRDDRGDRRDRVYRERRYSSSRDRDMSPEYSREYRRRSGRRDASPSPYTPTRRREYSRSRTPPRRYRRSSRSRSYQ